MAATPDSVDAYLDSLPPERAETVARVRDLVNANLPDGYEEVLAYGMIAWVVPLETYPDTYSKQPLMFAALAAQKRHYSLYLTCAYASEERTERLRHVFAEAGKRLDMGKSCLRFKGWDDLVTDAIAREIATPVATFVALYEEARAGGRA